MTGNGEGGESMPRQNEIGFTDEQLKILKNIHVLARQMEQIKNMGKVRAVISLIEELSNDFIDVLYFIEKANMLFDEYKITLENYEI